MKTTLGIPVLGQVPGESFVSHLGVAIELGRMSEVALISPLGLSPHSKAREYIITHSIRLGCDYILWVDDDNTLPIGSCKALFETLENTKSQLVSGYYVQRGYPFVGTWAREAKSAENTLGHIALPRNGEPVDIHGCGFGCCLMDLNWVKKNIPTPFFTNYELEGYTAEDIYFCTRIIKAGGKIVGDPRVICGHLWNRPELTPENADYYRKLTIEDMKNG